MTSNQFEKLYGQVLDKGYADEIEWSKNIKPCLCPYTFCQEAIWVILNSGMKNQVARKIEERIYKAIESGRPISEVFKHKGKVKAIEYFRNNYHRLFLEYQESLDKLAYLESLPHIGKITKYHLAKNLGHSCIKPDRHLVRIAKTFNTTPEAMCQRLADLTEHSLATIDTVIWRAANLGLI